MQISIGGRAPGQLELNLLADPVTRENFLSLAAEAGESPEMFLARLVQGHLEKLRDSVTPEHPLGRPVTDSDLSHVVKRLEALEARFDRTLAKSQKDGEPVQVVSIQLGKPNS